LYRVCYKRKLISGILFDMELKGKTVVCVFAHPDDEAFGPSGTIAKLAKDNEVYILCATRGEAAGQTQKNLGEIRSNELLKSANILGVKSVEFLGFIDGELSNNLYHQLADKIESRLNELKPDLLITFETRGVSGHVDHVVVSLATRFVFEKTGINELWYYCLSSLERKLIKDYFVYFPDGYEKEKVDKVVDVSDSYETKIKAINAHESQKGDIEVIMQILEKTPKEEYFLVVKK